MARARHRAAHHLKFLNDINGPIADILVDVLYVHRVISKVSRPVAEAFTREQRRGDMDFEDRDGAPAGRAAAALVHLRRPD